jgi:hypothetical protein
MACTNAADVAEVVYKLLGNDKFTKFITDQGLDAEAFAELEEPHLNTFRTAKEEPPSLGDIMKLKIAVREMKKRVDGLTAGTNQDGLGSTSKDNTISKNKRVANKIHGEGSSKLPFETSSLMKQTESKRSGSSLLFGRRNKIIGKRQSNDESLDPDYYTDNAIFRQAKKSRHLIDIFGAAFVLDLQKSYDLLKTNVDEAVKKMPAERLRQLDCQKNPKDRDLLDAIEKKTMLQFTEKFQGHLVTRDGRKVEWPKGRDSRCSIATIHQYCSIHWRIKASR